MWRWRIFLCKRCTNRICFELIVRIDSCEFPFVISNRRCNDVASKIWHLTIASSDNLFRYISRGSCTTPVPTTRIFKVLRLFAITMTFQTNSVHTSSFRGRHTTIFPYWSTKQAIHLEIVVSIPYMKSTHFALETTTPKVFLVNTVLRCRTFLAIETKVTITITRLTSMTAMLPKWRKRWNLWGRSRMWSAAPRS